MKKAKITFLPIAGTGALHIDFKAGPFGDATEARKGDGVGFFSANGELMGITFDDVDAQQDRQVLEFDNCRIEVMTKNGKVSYKLEEFKTHSKRRVA